MRLVRFVCHCVILSVILSVNRITAKVISADFIVFQATVLSRLTYALPACCPLLNVELVHKIDGFLKRSFR